MTKREPCDRADIVVQRMGWKVAPESRAELKAHIRIALDTEVEAGGPYLNNGWNRTDGETAATDGGKDA
jgi:hypothetical protein